MSQVQLPRCHVKALYVAQVLQLAQHFLVKNYYFSYCILRWSIALIQQRTKNLIRIYETVREHIFLTIQGWYVHFAYPCEKFSIITLRNIYLKSTYNGGYYTIQGLSGSTSISSAHSNFFVKEINRCKGVCAYLLYILYGLRIGMPHAGTS